MKTRQLERTSFCCHSYLYAILQQCKQAISPASDFIQPGPADLCIHNAHPPPTAYLTIKMTGATCSPITIT